MEETGWLKLFFFAALAACFPVKAVITGFFVKNTTKEIDMLNNRLKVGQQVALNSGGIPGFGGLNSLYLSEQGYCTGGYVIVVDVDCKYAKVLLPSGSELLIKETDIASII